MTIPIVFVLPDLGGGGAQKVILTIAGALDRERFSARILVGGGSQALAGFAPAGIPIEIGEATRMRDSMRWLIRRINELEPGICVSVMGYVNLALLGARALLPRRTRFVIREASTVAATISTLPRWLPGRQLYKVLYPRADLIITPTAAVRDEIAAVAPLAASRLRIILNPVDVEGLRASAVPVARAGGKGLRLVSAGRLTPAKGYDLLLELLSGTAEDTHITIFGEGEDRGTLEELARRKGIDHRVHFPGFARDLPPHVAGADAFVLSSRWEGLPNAVLESLALGTPVVASTGAQLGPLATQAGRALEVKPLGPEFLDAINACVVQPAHDDCRASLLPPAYGVEAVAEVWSQALIEMAA